MQPSSINAGTAAPISTTQRRRPPRNREALVGWLFLVPEFVGVAVFGLFPLLFSLFLSFCDWNMVGGLSAIHYSGLDNFKAMLHDSKVIAGLKNNVLYTLYTVPISMALALLAAVIIHSKVYFQSYFKVTFFIPYISSIIALSAVWSALFHPSLGPVNRLLTAIGVANPPKWLADTHYSLTSIIIIMIWAGIGYQIIIFLAGLSNIPQDLYEAADIDGANERQKFIRITLPLLGPTISFLVITLIMSSFKVFDPIAFLTQGGPNQSSTVLVYRIYEEGFQNFRMGYASAISWLLFLIVACVTFLTWKIQNKTTHY
ncbi:carbohydrate ABC transporter permease [Paenibacillus roseipurpureus]|uniref:Sugar ABC transporter permease n=1 Tax=Paenibacillus roseopurpureus TaxID=2918901 RepID=A0AA96RJ74_9BACL|nr:sugar ABC transporter permease [Paenibacillus sp. MBLB1832]WNR42994.1 sugar ABC transporter permease [Paenibacillus sp. MBLB1832]